MKIEILADEFPLILTDDHLDNPNYIELLIEDKEYLVPLSDLYHAVRAFYTMVEDVKTKEGYYTK